MTPPRFFLDRIDADPLVLTGEDARHAARALRLRPGEEVTVGDGRGGVARGVVVAEPSAHRVEVRVLERTVVPRPEPSVRVFPAMPKAGKLDLVVQKLTEIGVDRISPWFAERSVVRWDEAKRRASTRRAEQIAIAAAKQSSRAWLPLVDEPADLTDLTPSTLVFDEAAEARFSTVVPALRSAREIGVVVGPEGGLDDAERERFARAGAVLVSLGPQVLRSETASIVASTLVLNAVHLLG